MTWNIYFDHFILVCQSGPSQLFCSDYGSGVAGNYLDLLLLFVLVRVFEITCVVMNRGCWTRMGCKSTFWNSSKTQVDLMDAQKNKHICILFWWKTALENAKTWVLPNYTRFSKTPNINLLIISDYFETCFSALIKNLE